MEKLYRILIIDDNEAAAQALAKLLEYRGHTVRVGHLGAEALTIVPEYGPDIIVLDIGLPDLDGYEVAKKLRSDVKTKATIIALTGYGQYEDREKAQAAGFDFHLTKPAGLRDIESILANIPRPESSPEKERAV